MTYYFDEEKVDIDLKKLKFLNKGCQGSAYKFFYNYKNYVIKIFDDDNIKEENFAVLKNLSTERILLPKKLVYNNEKQFIGYITIFCKTKKIKKIIDISKQKYINELVQLLSEIKYLSDNNIIINDWNFSNFIFDGKFRLIDPGQYEYCQMDKNYCYHHNYLILCDFIANKLLHYMLLANTDYARYYSLQLYEKSENNIIKFYQEEIKEKETVYQYTKRITKNKSL